MADLLKLATAFDKKAGILGDIGHIGLDLFGLIPGIGETADLSNTLWYLSDEDYLFAALSLISVIPELGDLIGKGGKLAAWLTKTFPKGAKMVAEHGPKVADSIRAVRSLIKNNKDLIDKIFDKAQENEKLSKYVPRMREALDIFEERGERLDVD
jgi:hypothetical protein